jgi:alpha-beta hydrolase superfamily lysophospholipase
MRPRRGRSAGGVLAVAFGIAAGAAFIAATGIAVLAGAVATTLVKRPTKRVQDVRIYGADLDAAQITIQATPDTALRGTYGFWFSDDTGYARLGEIVSRAPGTVTRRVLTVSFGDLARARAGRLSGWVFLGPGELGVPYQDVTVATPIGPAPAWLVPAAEKSGRWVIQVHGRAVLRQETLRSVEVFRAAGYQSLLVSYRNDGEAPDSTDHRYGLGDTEWEDVDAAMCYARENGATSVVLMGWSMGGAIALQAAMRSANRRAVAGIVLDSPVITWADVLAYQGAARRLPTAVIAGALAILGHPRGGVVTGQHAPVDLARLDLVARSGELSVPVLVMHSDDDGYVPAAASRELAARRPDLVTYVPFAPARHTKLWNYDPDKWNGAIRSWLAKL